MITNSKMGRPRSPLDISPVIPVVVLQDAASAVPVARALVAGGIAVIEVTLRTPAALDAIARIATEVPEIAVGAGTVRTPADVEAAMNAGAAFLVSPGTTPALAEALSAADAPVLPGCSTISEALVLREHGFAELKVFPAAAVGGVRFLRAAATVLPDLRFCPTGGISPETAAGFLAVSAVPCVGGTWLTPASVLAEHAWSEITRAATAAASLRKSSEAV